MNRYRREYSEDLSEYNLEQARAAREFSRKLTKSSKDKDYVICGSGQHWVKSFTRKSGEFVEGHCAKNPAPYYKPSIHEEVK